ncbi:MAG: PDZ domain-containing protein [Pirellulales bacterium]|nr:PDZ domain-containing protein [Pirellulales bacterium]
MTRSFLGTAPALAAALWLGGAASQSTAQSVVDTAVDSSSDTAAGANASTGAADTATDAGSSTEASTEASTSTESSTNAPSTVTSPSSDTAAIATGQTDVRSDAQPQADASATADTSAAASTGSGTQTPPAESSIQAGASTDAAVDASADPNAAQPDNATPGAGSADATVQGQAGVNTNTQAGVQQNLATGLQFGQATDRGLAINTIARDHFFYNSGIRQGDVLVSYAGRPIRSDADFRQWAVYQPGQRVPVVVLREGRPQTIYVTYQQRPGVEHQAGYAQSHSGAYLGVSFDPQDSSQARIRSVNPGSPAERAGLRPGDVIHALNGNHIGGSQDVIRAVASMQPGQPLDVAVSRQVMLGNRPGVAQAATYAPDAIYQDPGTTVRAVPTIPAPQAAADAAVDTGAYVGRDAATGGERFDNTPARAGDTDRDGRLLDADGRVGPVEGRAVLPRRRN